MKEKKVPEGDFKVHNVKHTAAVTTGYSIYISPKVTKSSFIHT